MQIIGSVVRMDENSKHIIQETYSISTEGGENAAVAKVDALAARMGGKIIESHWSPADKQAVLVIEYPFTSFN